MSQTDETRTDETGAGSTEVIRAVIVIRDGNGVHWIGSASPMHVNGNYVIGKVGHPDEATFGLHGVTPEEDRRLVPLRAVFGGEVDVTRFDPATQITGLTLPPEA